MENNYKEKYLKYKAKYAPELSAAMGKSTKDLPDDFFKGYEDIDSYLEFQITSYVEVVNFQKKLNKYNKKEVIKEWLKK